MHYHTTYWNEERKSELSLTSRFRTFRGQEWCLLGTECTISAVEWATILARHPETPIRALATCSYSDSCWNQVSNSNSINHKISSVFSSQESDQNNVTLLQHLRTILWSIIQIYNSTEDLDHKQVQITSPLTEADVIRSIRFLGRRKVLLTLIQNVLICPALLKSLHSSEAFLTKTDNILIITSSNQIIKIYSIRHHAVTIKRSPNVKLNSRKFQWLFASMLKGIMQDLRWIEVHSLGWLYSDEGGKYLWKEATRLLGN